MGTNYYHRASSKCPHCGKELPDIEERHIGKGSFGWTFSFHGDKEIRSLDDWLMEFIKGGEIKDEYGAIVNVEEFVKLIEAYSRQPNNHAKMAIAGEWGEGHAQNHWIDEHGHGFSSGEFC